MASNRTYYIMNGDVLLPAVNHFFGVCLPFQQRCVYGKSSSMGANPVGEHRKNVGYLLGLDL